MTPGYTATARSLVGEDTTLAVEQLVVVGTDPRRARAVARGPLGFLGKVPAYQASFRRMGFTGQEIAQLSDRLVDALVPWGSPDSVAAAITRQLQAGADHVAISVTADPSQPQAAPGATRYAAGMPRAAWRRPARARAAASDRRIAGLRT